MLANELYEIFIIELKYKVKNLERIPEKVIAYWISEGEALIREAVGFYETSTEIIITEETEYILPADFSRELVVKDSDRSLVKKNLAEILSTDRNVYAIYYSSNRWYLKVSLDTTVSTLTVFYKLGTELKADASDYYGSGTISGTIDLPDESIKVLKDYLLSKVIPEFANDYRQGLIKLKSLSAFRHNTKLTYNMNGVI